MTTPRQKSRFWEDKLRELAKAKRDAMEAELVGIYQARQEGVSQAVVAAAIGHKSGSGIAPKEAKGKAIVERRRGSRGDSSTP